MRHLQTIAILLSCLAAGCQSLDEDPLPAPEALLEQAVALEIKNPSAPAPGLLCAGQLTEAQLDALAAAGYRTFINLRSEGEEGTGWEAERAQALGVDYVSLPIAGAPDVTEAAARRLDAVLAEAEAPVALYCGSSNRVGALYALRAYHVQGASADESLALGLAAGMTRLEPVVREQLGLEAP